MTNSEDERSYSLVNFFVFDTSRNFPEDEVCKKKSEQIVGILIFIFGRNTKVLYIIIRRTLRKTIK